MEKLRDDGEYINHITNYNSEDDNDDSVSDDSYKKDDEGFMSINM